MIGETVGGQARVWKDWMDGRVDGEGGRSAGIGG